MLLWSPFCRYTLVVDKVIWMLASCRRHTHMWLIVSFYASLVDFLFLRSLNFVSQGHCFVSLSATQCHSSLRKMNERRLQPKCTPYKTLCREVCKTVKHAKLWQVIIAGCKYLRIWFKSRASVANISRGIGNQGQYGCTLIIIQSRIIRSVGVG